VETETGTMRLNRRRFLAQAGGTALLSCAPAWASLPAAADTPTGATEGNESTKVFWKSGAGPGQVAVLAGHGLDRSTISIARLTDEASSAPQGLNNAEQLDRLPWVRAQTVGLANSYAYIEVPQSWQIGQYAVRLQGDDGLKAAFLLNHPEVWWCLGESGKTAPSGSELRIFGQFLELRETPPHVRILDSSGNVHSLAPEKATPYSLTVKLPSNLLSGKATVQVHNGFGGASGWSEPFVLEIERSVEWPSQVYRVTDFGATGDSLHDDTAAFHSALEAADRNHGGVVFVPNGVYRITAQLTMPARVALRGESREHVWLMIPKETTGLNTVIAGTREFAVEELSIVAQSPSRIITAPDVPSMYTGYPPYGDPGKDAAFDVRLHRLRIHHLRYAHRLGESAKDPRRLEDAGPSTIALAGPRISIRDCIVVSPGMPIVLHRISHSRVTGNEFRIGRNGWYGFWGARETLVEGNTFEGQDLEASYGSFANYGDGSGPDISQIYVADNRYLNSFGGEREALTFDSSGAYPWKGGLAAAAANAVTLNADVPDGADDWAGLGCLVTGGRGLGQLRKVLSSKDRTVSVDVPWDVTPDETSTVAIMPFKRDVVVYRNYSQDASVGVQLWGGGYNFIIDGNKTIRSGGFWGSAAEYTDTQTKPATQYFLPLYFTQWLHNEVKEGFVFEQGPDTTNGAVCGLYVRDVLERPDGGVLTFANIIRDNRLHDRAKIVLRYYSDSPYLKQLPAIRHLRRKPWSLATLIEGNTISDSPVGIDIEPGFEGVVLRNNRFIRVTQEIASYSH
jgi:hypothetical protein